MEIKWGRARPSWNLHQTLTPPSPSFDVVGTCRKSWSSLSHNWPRKWRSWRRGFGSSWRNVRLAAASHPGGEPKVSEPCEQQHCSECPEWTSEPGRPWLLLHVFLPTSCEISLRHKLPWNFAGKRILRVLWFATLPQYKFTVSPTPGNSLKSKVLIMGRHFIIMK